MQRRRLLLFYGIVEEGGAVGVFGLAVRRTWLDSAATGDFIDFEAAVLLHAALLLVVGSRYFVKGGQWAFSADSPKDMAVQCATAVVAIFGLVVQRHGRTTQALQRGRRQGEGRVTDF